MSPVTAAIASAALPVSGFHLHGHRKGSPVPSDSTDALTSSDSISNPTAPATNQGIFSSLLQRAEQIAGVQLTAPTPTAAAAKPASITAPTAAGPVAPSAGPIPPNAGAIAPSAGPIAPSAALVPPGTAPIAPSAAPIPPSSTAGAAAPTGDGSLQDLLQQIHKQGAPGSLNSGWAQNLAKLYLPTHPTQAVTAQSSTGGRIDITA